MLAVKRLLAWTTTAAAVLSLLPSLGLSPQPAAAESLPQQEAGAAVPPAGEGTSPPVSAEPSPPGPILGIPASPAAVDPVPGTGALGRWLGIPADSPWRLGGAWVGNGGVQLGGGVTGEDGVGLAQQFLLDLSLDLEKSMGWKGGKIWVQGLQINANNAAAYASGSVQGVNSLVDPPTLARTELYSFALAQNLFDGQLRVLLGKLVASNDFANVVTPVQVGFDSPYAIPGISSLTYKPLYAIPATLGRLPGYPDSALGISFNLQPNAFQKSLYLKGGIYDGRSGLGVNPPVETGRSMPSLSGPLFAIGEIGGSWNLGSQALPGAAGFGVWNQSGPLSRCNDAGTSCLTEASAAGGYLIAQQRLLNFRYPRDGSGISTFLQLGWSPSVTNLFTSSVGGGFTVFAPMPSRLKDSYGVGVAWARLNDQGFLATTYRPSELMLQVYGQIHLAGTVYLTPSITILPYLGLQQAVAPSSSALLQLVALF